MVPGTAMVRTGMSQILDASSARTTDGSLAGLMPTVGGVVNKNEVNCKKKKTDYKNERLDTY